MSGITDSSDSFLDSDSMSLSSDFFSDTDFTTIDTITSSSESEFQKRLHQNIKKMRSQNIASQNGSNSYFYSEWKLYFHCFKDDWKITGFKHIFTIKNIKQFWDFHNLAEEYLGGINSQHYFLMRDNIKPIWEDGNNKQGGCWSFKIPANEAPDLWQKLAMYMVGETMIEKSTSITGISCCLRNNNTTVIKIWNNDRSLKKLDLLPEEITKKYAYTILYKPHVPEY